MRQIIDYFLVVNDFSKNVFLDTDLSNHPVNFSNHPVPLSKEGSTFSPSPSSSGSGDVAGDAIALPEFWYRKRSLCPKGLAMIAYATELRLFVRCYTALLGGGANRVNFLSMLVGISFYAS